MAIEIFNRYEKKYMIDKSVYEAITGYLTDYMEPDRYCVNGKKYTICNIYFDTDTDELIRRSIDKPVYKEKLRLRSYGTPSDDSEAFIEIKKKYKGVVNKRRTTMTLKEAENFIYKGMIPDSPEVNRQVLSEIRYFLDYYKVSPKVYISYERSAFYGIEDDSFRVTFDDNILARRDELDLRKGSFGEPILDKDKLLMEVKTSGGIPMWFLPILSEYEIYPISFSKYGTEYRNYFTNYKGDITYV